MKNFFLLITFLLVNLISSYGQVEPCQVWTQDCDPNTGEYIQRVVLNQIDNETSCQGNSAYNFFRTAAILTPGQQYDMQIDIANNHIDDQVGVWVDLDNDGRFNGVGEQLYKSSVTSSEMNFQISVPAGTAPGVYRMRIRLNRGDVDPCEQLISYGEAEDYLIIVPKDTPAAGVNVCDGDISTFFFNNSPYAEDNLSAIVNNSILYETDGTITALKGEAGNRKALHFKELSGVEVINKALPKYDESRAISLWVNLRGDLGENIGVYQHNNEDIFRYGINGKNKLFGVYTVPEGGKRKLRFRGMEGGSVDFDITTDAADHLTLNTWYHLTFVYENFELITYINGVEVSRYPVVLNTEPTNQFLLGGINGLFDDLRIYNRSISSGEVSYLYNNKEGGSCDYGNYTPDGPVIDPSSVDVCSDLVSKFFFNYSGYFSNSYTSDSDGFSYVENVDGTQLQYEDYNSGNIIKLAVVRKK